MVSTTDLENLITAHGMLLLMPLGIIEGPIVTVAAGWMSRLSLLSPIPAIIVLVVADLIGDSLLYLAGRYGVKRLPARLRRIIGLTDARLERVDDHFRDAGPSTLVIGKVTHSAGFAVLLAAGAAHMPFVRFILWNLVATIPKTLLLFGLGWVFGHALSGIDNGISILSALFLVVIGLAVLVWSRVRVVPAE